MGGMRLAAPLLLVAALAGCGNTAVGVSTGAPPSGNANITTGSGAAALGLVLIFGTMDYIHNPQPFPNPADLFSPTPSREPDLATSRRISEQDCSKPVDLTLGNLRCK